MTRPRRGDRQFKCAPHADVGRLCGVRVDEVFEAVEWAFGRTAADLAHGPTRTRTAIRATTRTHGSPPLASAGSSVMPRPTHGPRR